MGAREEGPEKAAKTFISARPAGEGRKTNGWSKHTKLGLPGAQRFPHTRACPSCHWTAFCKAGILTAKLPFSVSDLEILRCAQRSSILNTFRRHNG